MTSRYCCSFGLLQNQNQLLSHLSNLGKRFVIITHEQLAEKYGFTLKNTLSSFGLEVFLLSFPSGEANKTRETKALLENNLLELGMARDVCMIALGGGVVSDLVGFLSATYCRGVPHVIIPTSLLAMVDACIGGKTGVNTPYGKNMIGAIYQPKKILIDSQVLATLPLNEIKNGVVEMIKHGLIADSLLFEYLENHSEDILNLNHEVIEKVLVDNYQIKNSIVEEDEKEQGKRRLLNFGHTIGHALEHLLHFQISHGEAVAIGIIVESFLSVELGLLELSSFERIFQLLKLYQLPLKINRKLSVEEIFNAMKLDKKSLQGTPRFVMLSAIGSTVPFDGTYCTSIDKKLLEDVLEKWFSHDLCGN